MRLPRCPMHIFKVLVDAIPCTEQKIDAKCKLQKRDEHAEGRASFNKEVHGK